ncbi:MAG: hypothetical protein RLZZ414_1916 [Bacteroidota bacterium]|jgi:hypothetical protein
MFSFLNFLNPKGQCVDVNGVVIPYAFTKKPIHYKMWIAHYYLKSEEEFNFKITRGRAYTNKESEMLKMQGFYELDKECTKEYNFVKDLYLKLITK